MVRIIGTYLLSFATVLVIMLVAAGIAFGAQTG